jgi:hypothetical protein
VLSSTRKGHVDGMWLGDEHKRQPDHIAQRVLVPAEAADRAAVLQLVPVRGGVRTASPAVQNVDDLVLSPMLQHSTRVETPQLWKGEETAKWDGWT